jgi:glycosyltransferase involved in cell wall biosynthesis
MGHGLPVVTTDRCGRVVADGKNGFLVPAGSADALATALARLDDDRELLARMSVAARATAAEFHAHLFPQAFDRLVANVTGARR